MSSTSSLKFKIYLECESSIYAVKLPKDINYMNLVRYVKKKYDINHNYCISLHYNDGFNNIKVSDDDDVEFFVNEVCCMQNAVQKLFIKIIKQTLEVNSSYKHIDFDLNVSLFPEEFNVERPKVEQNNYEHLHEEWEKFSFKNIPSPPHAPNVVSKTTSTRRIDVACMIQKKDEFDDKAECIYVIGEKALREGFEYEVYKSCTKRYSVKCANPECNWFIRTRKNLIGPKFYVSNINDIHTCSQTQINPNHRNATKKLLGHLLFDKVKDSRRIYTARDIQNDFNREWNIDISYKRAWWGKNVALELAIGCPKASFAQLPYYCHNLKLANEGTVTHIETDDEDRFKMVFIAFGVTIRSFLCFMRPLIIIDAAHLKGTYLGTNLLAVGMDGNNQIIPIATGVSQGETIESWSWFMTKLKECIGEVPGLAIISDRHPAIINACTTVFPNAFHGYCCRHLMMNCKIKGDKLKAIYWKTCKSYRKDEFERSISKLQGLKPEAVRKLQEAGYSNWSRAYCPANRYNYLTSNSAESINALTRDYRKLPVTKLMEYYRKLVQKWYCERRQKYEDAPNDELTDWAAKKVNNRMLKSANWQVDGIDQDKLYQVTGHRQVHTVDLTKGECTCRKWQLSGLPCGHVCAVSRVVGLTNCNMWALAWFTKTTLKATYEQKVYPLEENVCMWRVPDDVQVVLPPLMDKRPVGRPKNKDRIPSQNEEPKIKRCGRCGNTGHNRNACHAPLPVTKKRKTNTSVTREQESSTRANFQSQPESSTRNAFHSQPESSTPNTPYYNFFHLDDF